MITIIGCHVVKGTGGTGKNVNTSAVAAAAAVGAGSEPVYRPTFRSLQEPPQSRPIGGRGQGRGDE